MCITMVGAVQDLLRCKLLGCKGVLLLRACRVHIGLGALTLRVVMFNRFESKPHRNFDIRLELQYSTLKNTPAADSISLWVRRYVRRSHTNSPRCAPLGPGYRVMYDQ